MKRLSKRLKRRWHEDERFRFLAVGGWNTLFGYLCFLGVYALLRSHLHYLVIGLISHAISVVNAFACHRLLSFRSQGPLLVEFVRFNLSQLFVIACGLLALWIFVTLAGVTPLLGQAVVVAASVVISYLAHRRFTFAVR